MSVILTLAPVAAAVGFVWWLGVRKFLLGWLVGTVILGLASVFTGAPVLEAPFAAIFLGILACAFPDGYTGRGRV